MIYHFQYRGPSGWETLGSGIGTGERAIEQALEEVRGLSGSRLPSGDYRGIAAGDGDSHFIHFELTGAADPGPSSGVGAISTVGPIRPGPTAEEVRRGLVR